MMLFVFVQHAQAQTKSVTFKVSGNCGMCKKTIEGAAKNSGATYANWDADSKIMTVKYASAKSSFEKIQKGIADAGYDNEKYIGSDDAYNKLNECCKYDRNTTAAAATETGACCVKDGKCTGDKPCCKKTDGKSDCCANGTCGKAGGCCATCEKGGDCCKKTGTVAKADCCKDGKCTHH